jgi:hypothetical protein
VREQQEHSRYDGVMGKKIFSFPVTGRFVGENTNLFQWLDARFPC